MYLNLKCIDTKNTDVQSAMSAPLCEILNIAKIRIIPRILQMIGLLFRDHNVILC